MATAGGGGADGEGELDMGELDMGALLDSMDMPEPRVLHRGEVVEGAVMKADREGALIDLVGIGSKSEGIVPVHEMHSLGSDPLSKVAVGDEVLVYVLQAETDEGQVLLSIDRARGEQGWRVLQDRFESGEIFDGEVTGFNTGGLLANVEGVNAFIPMSQVVGAKPGADGANPLSDQVGRSLRLKVIEINRRRNRAILSERAALQEWRTEQKERLLDELTEGEIRTGTVTSIRNFGVFIDLGGADGLAHLSELSWDRNAAPEDLFKAGDEVKVYVMKVDRESKKIALSVRRAAPEQWESMVAQYQVGDVVPGVVTKLVAFGAFTRLPGPVEGLIHVSELVDRRINHPEEIVEEGDVIPLKIVRIEHDRHRLGLSLREARAEAQTRGWEFDDGGRVVAVSEDGSAAFGDETAAVASRYEERRTAVAARQQSLGGAGEAGGGGGGGGGAPAREREEAAPVTAIAAAMEQARAQLEAQTAGQAEEGQEASDTSDTAQEPAATEAVAEAPAESPQDAEPAAELADTEPAEPVAPAADADDDAAEATVDSTVPLVEEISAEETPTEETPGS